jgi:hypothetical protein
MTLTDELLRSVVALADCREGPDESGYSRARHTCILEVSFQVDAQATRAIRLWPV